MKCYIYIKIEFYQNKDDTQLCDCLPTGLESMIPISNEYCTMS